MSQNTAAERPDANVVLDGLKGFQRDTVEYAFERLYRAPDSTRRFLVADEVGLGKTLIARGVIAKAIEHLWDGHHRVERIDIVYICSNAQIARQNIRRLQIGTSKFWRADRLTLLPQEIHGLRANKVNYLALTPGTSLDLRSSMGRRDERVLLYYLVQRVWPDPHTGPKNLFQGWVKSRDSWRGSLQKFKRSRRIDETLAKAFEYRLDEAGDNFREWYLDLCKRFQRFRKKVPDHDRREQAALIGKLRSMLAEVCVTALEPDLVILDEFQRFKDILDGEGATAELAKRLFSYSDDTSDVRLLLLSATPYRMYTLQHESAEDDHYRDFLRTVEFLDPEIKESGELRQQLGDYRQAMYRIDSHTGEHVQELVSIKEQIETQLRRVMSRTERLPASRDSQGMLREAPRAELKLTADDVRDFVALEKIGRQVGQPQVLEYWKSAPYLLSFMDDYKLKSEVAARLDKSSESGLAKLLTGSGRVFLSWKDIEDYAKIDPANARLRSVFDWLVRGEAWKLLWLPASLPYYADSGAWRTARERQFSKRLIFSTWTVVPKAIASMVSYEVERRIFQRFDKEMHNTPEERRKRRPLLRFGYTQGRLTGMPVLGLLYPSPSLVALGDPAQRRQREATLEDAISRARKQLEPLLEQLARPYLAAEREDESWYWAAPILLDLERHGKSTREWFARNDLADRWAGAEKDEEEGSRWEEHVAEARELVEATRRGPLDLGRPPADLAEVLATRSVAGPATSALRALTRASGPETPAACAARDSAARIAWGFRALFNLPEAMAIVRGEWRDKIPFWRQVVNYCAAGNLQAVLDEYVHMLRDLEGLFAANDEDAWVRLADAVTAALSLRTGTARVDDIQSANGMARLERHRLRNHFAMRFGTQENDDGKAGAREEQVRQAFNSPFWPFALVSTSVGQEGLDFHAYCHAVMHWNLPSNPVDLEQREGRVHRYKGYAVRKNVAARHGDSVLGGPAADMWQALFETAHEHSSGESGLVPYWLYPLPDGAHIEQHVPALPLSRDADQLKTLKRSLAVYRMVFGQPRQDDLLSFLLERCCAKTLQEIGSELRIDLSPKRAARL